MDNEGKQIYKVLLLGDSNVGKTCIIERYVNNDFNDSHMITIGIDYFNKNIVYENKKYTLKIWDTAGQERYRSLSKNMFRNVDGIVLVFDITNRSSFDHIDNWIKDISNFTDKTTPIIICGNKSDSQYKPISESDGKELAQKYKTTYLSVSAKENTNIEDIFYQLVHRINKSGKKVHIKEKEIIVDRVKNKKSCC